jgi:NhaP-type Na+/H+ or K+/H+ antiporter
MAFAVAGTILTALSIAATARWRLGFEIIPSLLLGAILASTDPVLLRDVLRDRRTPQAVRQILSVESGMNDAVALPAILILIAVAGGRLHSATSWVGFALPVFVLSPLVGVVVAWVGMRGLTWVDRRIGVRRDTVTVGVAFIAYATADALAPAACWRPSSRLTIATVSICASVSSNTVRQMPNC